MKYSYVRVVNVDQLYTHRCLVSDRGSFRVHYRTTRRRDFRLLSCRLSSMSEIVVFVRIALRGHGGLNGGVSTKFPLRSMGYKFK